MWNIRYIKVIRVVVGALGSTSKKLKYCIEELGVVKSTALLQKTALLGTACILMKALDCRLGLWKQGLGEGKKGGKRGGRGGGGRGGEDRIPKTEQM